MISEPDLNVLRIEPNELAYFVKGRPPLGDEATDEPLTRPEPIGKFQHAEQTKSSHVIALAGDRSLRSLRCAALDGRLPIVGDVSTKASGTRRRYKGLHLRWS